MGRAGRAGRAGRPDGPAPAPARSAVPRHVLRFLALAARARLRAAWHHGLRHDDWNIGVVDAPIASFLANEATPRVAWAPTARGRYAADPFALDRGAELQVHYEDYLHATGAASIARRRWSREAGWGRPAPALRIGSHLSYPMLVEHDGRYLMLPESRASGNLVLYASDSLDGPWLPAATLDVDGAVGDATLVRHEDRWWLFAVAPSRLNPFAELHLWFADRPEGPWHEHPRNPVVVDPRSARPAGRPFVVEGRLYRPGQDCSTGYGRRVTIKRIVVLTTEDYREELATVVRPDPAGPFPHGLHTITGVGQVTLIDGKRYVWNTAALVRTLRGRLRR